MRIFSERELPPLIDNALPDVVLAIFQSDVLKLLPLTLIKMSPVDVTLPPSATENTSVDPSYKFKISAVPL